MFYKAESFNQDISKWNVSRAEDLDNMFYEAKSFSRNLDKWNVSKDASDSFMFMGSKLEGNEPVWYHVN
jgi:surface protein